MIELRSTVDKKPIVCNTIENAETIAYLTFMLFDVKVLMKYEGCDEQFEYTPSYKQDFSYNAQQYVDSIILGKDYASLGIEIDYKTLFVPIFEANEKLVEQYKAGNEKALNALLGKFLKDNKGVDPKEVKVELIKLLS